jgi:hypothetical protein
MAESEKKSTGVHVVRLNLYLMEFKKPVQKLVIVEPYTHLGLWRKNTSEMTKSKLQTQMVQMLRSLECNKQHRFLNISWDGALLASMENYSLIDGYDDIGSYVVRIDTGVGEPTFLVYPVENVTRLCATDEVFLGLEKEDIFNCKHLSFDVWELQCNNK